MAESIRDRIRDLLDADADAPDEVVAKQVLNSEPLDGLPDLVFPLVVAEVANQRRNNVRYYERAVFGGRHRRHGTGTEADPIGDRNRVRELLMSSEFKLDYVGTKVVWGLANDDEHATRQAFLRGMTHGIEHTIAIHQYVRDLLAEHGVTCLADLPDDVLDNLDADVLAEVSR